ncbi:MAG: hypothetical protein ABSB31_05415 [Dehalococcoidia bacterium]
MNRALSKQDIPDELWANNTVLMPANLASSYESLLREYGVYDKAVDTNNVQGIVGGASRTDTLEHFARRYGVSSCRIESLVLDPQAAFSATSDLLLNILSDGRVAILDLACGAGSVGASLLTTVCTLRRQNVLPKVPTSINILGTDCSNTALEIYSKMMSRLKTDMGSVGIEAQVATLEWFAEESSRTSDVFDLWFQSNPNPDDYVVFVADFSGILMPNFEKYASTVQHVFDRPNKKRCTIVWVEPGGFSKATKLFEEITKRITKSSWQQSGPFKHDYKWFHPFQRRDLECRIQVLTYLSGQE